MKNTVAKNSRSNNIARWVLFAVLGVVLIGMATGQAGISNYIELLETKEKLENAVISLNCENQLLNNKIELLKKSSEIQLKYIKETFGYIEKGEYIYLYNPKAVNKKAKQANNKLNKLNPKS